MAGMSRQTPGRGNGRSNGGSGGGPFAAGAGFAAAKGAALIVVALIIGIVLLNVVDDGSNDVDSAGSSSEDNGDTTDTSGATTDPTTAPTTVDTVPARTPAELVVLVLNGGAPQGTARTMSDNLKVAGYTNQPEPSDWEGLEQAGNLVLCRPGLDEEAGALATAVGPSTPISPFPDPIPPGSETSDCVVVVGVTA
jgi:hypothetical protein